MKLSEGGVSNVMFKIIAVKPGISAQNARYIIMHNLKSKLSLLALKDITIACKLSANANAKITPP